MATKPKLNVRQTIPHNECMEAVLKEDQKRINILISERKHNAFKAKTAKEGLRMTEYLLKCIDDYLSK